MIRDMIISFFLIGVVSYSEINIKIHEPIRFENINMSTISDAVVGKGTIEISTDDLESDYGKKLSLKFPKTGLMTNRKRWLKIERYIIEDKDRNIIVENRRRLINIYAVIDRKSINDGRLDSKVLEGEYVGYIPIVINQYGRALKREKTE